MKLGQFCREYRLSIGTTLKDIEGSDDIKSLSAFEHGRSTNFNHYLKYWWYAAKVGDVDNFNTKFSDYIKGESK